MTLPNGHEAEAFNNYQSKLRPVIVDGQRCAQQRKNTLTLRPWKAAAAGWTLESLGQQVREGLLASELRGMVQGMQLVELQGHILWQSSLSAQFPYHQDTEDDA